MVKILLVDIETAPNIAYVWGAWKQNVSVKQMMEYGHIMSFAAKWFGSDEIFYEENRKSNDESIVTKLIRLFDEADIVIAHNGKRFDEPTIMGRALKYNINPPSPYKWVDTLDVARKEFRFVHNSLEGLAELLGCTKKDGHKKYPGFELWLECLRGNDEAWAEMEHYNIQDVIVLEEIYVKMLPWIKNHPNVGVLLEEDRPVCPKCGSHHIQLRGYVTTNVGKYRKFQCQSCGGWARTRYTEYDKDKRKELLVNAI